MNNDLEKILKFRDARKWGKHHTPKNLAMSLSIEAAEILEIFQWNVENDLPPDAKAALVDEIADVYWYLLLLAHATGINIKSALNNKITKNSKKYPVKTRR